MPYIFPEVLNRDKALLEEWRRKQEVDEVKREKAIPINNNMQETFVFADIPDEQEVKQVVEIKYLVGAFDMAIDLKERLII